MFNLNSRLLNDTLFFASSMYLVFIFTPLYDLISISASGVYFLYFILGYLIYYIVTILKLFDYDLVTAKISIFIEFLREMFKNKIKILKKIQNFYSEIFMLFSFFIDFFLTIFFLIFLKKKKIENNFNFSLFFIFFNGFKHNSLSSFEKSFIFKQ